MRAAPLRIALLRPFALVIALLVGVSVHADIVELKNGGKIHGKVANPDDKTAKSVYISTEGGTLTLPRSEVVRVVGQSPKQDEYHRRAARR